MGTPTDTAFAEGAWTSDSKPFPSLYWICTVREWVLPTFQQYGRDTDYDEDDDDLEVGWP
jgi:hypothetical protein